MNGSLHPIDGSPQPEGERRLGPASFLFRDRPDSCRECGGCVRHCPARAIRALGSRPEIIEEKCVKCGACVVACGNAGYEVRDDLGLVTDLLAEGRPVVAVLATEFVAAMHPLSPLDLERALEAQGFYAVESTLLGEEMVALEYEKTHARPSPLVLRSTCPVAVSWVQRFHPSLVSALAPNVPPYVAQARLVKELYPAGTAVVYVSPCYARKDEAYDEQFGGAIDAAIDFDELRRLVGHTRPRVVSAMGAPPGSRRPQPVKELSLTDGFPRRTMTERDMTDGEVQVVRGLDRLDRLLRGIEAGEAAPAIVDMLSCEGCVDGPAVNPGMSLFAKRNVVAAERAANVYAPVSSRALLSHLPSVSLRRSFAAEPFIAPVPSEAEVDAVLAEGEIASRSAALDCGACGYDTCVEHAVAIVQGNSNWGMCFPLQRDRLSRHIRELSESATIDSLTGLWNRRAFSERLQAELSRAARYGGDVSLLMVDVDEFKGVNDRFGHLVGDGVLSRVAELMRANLRMSDVPARYGGDEFAVILPGTDKTHAYIVAEKLREDMARTPLAFTVGGAEIETTVTLSVGVAGTRRGMADPLVVLEAADRALYEAKESGKDQVRLASG